MKTKQMKIAFDVLGDRYQISDVMFIDPGLGGTGFAKWDILQNHPFMDELDMSICMPCEPSSIGLINVSRSSLPWEERMRMICEKFEDDHLYEHRPRIVVIEFPEVWTTSAKSMASAADGDLFKLCSLVGAMIYICQSNPNVKEVHLIKPKDWKGQMKKDPIKKRIARKLPDANDSGFLQEHVADAVGMGLATMGVL